MLLKIYLISILLFLVSCSNLEFVYKDDLNVNNPIYKKTSFALSGLEIQSFYGENLRYFGEYEEELYKLVIDIDEEKTKRIVLEGDVPSPVNPPNGCPFHPRCPKAKDICKTEVPKLRKYTTNGNDHFASCHLIDLPERN